MNENHLEKMNLVRVLALKLIQQILLLVQVGTLLLSLVLL